MTDDETLGRPLPGNELRERRRRRMAASIELAALRLFAARGFDAVTVNDIAAAADISRRTFFRYFPSKESVLFGDPDGDEQLLADILEQRPASEGPVEALHHALVQLARATEENVEVTQLRLRVLESSAEITAQMSAQRLSFRRRVSLLVAARMGVDPEQDMRPDLIVNVSTSAMWVGMHWWLVNGAREPLHEVSARALAFAADGLVQTASLASTRASAAR